MPLAQTHWLGFAQAVQLTTPSPLNPLLHAQTKLSTVAPGLVHAGTAAVLSRTGIALAAQRAEQGMQEAVTSSRNWPVGHRQSLPSGEENCPAPGHCTHSDCIERPGCGPYVPPAHGLQAVRAEMLVTKVPVGHGVQAVACAVAEMVP